MLADVDYLRPENPDYWMLPVRRLLGKLGLRRGEFNLLMGVCRQVRGVAARARAGRGRRRDNASGPPRGAAAAV
jgi:tRNA/rRNA methyltransferase